MKYVVVRAPGGEAPVLFTREFMHKYVAGLLAPMEVVGAGFVRWVDGRVECYGISAGLNIAARPERDTDLVRRALADGDGGTDKPTAFA